MKRIRIVQAAILVAIVVLISSCGSSREYYNSYPRSQASISLILGPAPGMVMSRVPTADVSEIPMHFIGGPTSFLSDRQWVINHYLINGITVGEGT
jgi:hypothetical protein